jgi:hypothetical protein
LSPGLDRGTDELPLSHTSAEQAIIATR